MVGTIDIMSLQRLMNRYRSALMLLALVAMTAVSVAGSQAASIWNGAFERTWARTDKPVADLDVSRTWMWGPEPFTGGIVETYAEGERGERIVQYFDKSRMEITSDPTIETESPWYVTNGLLATELITGRVQVGDNEFWEWESARIPVAGDPLDENAPTYATFNRLLRVPPADDGAVIRTRVDRSGRLFDDPELADDGVTAVWHVQEDVIDHQIASTFWEFMNGRGTIYDGRLLRTDGLFVNPFYATGYPITEAYWTTVELAGVQAEVLVQCFQRRCLTYTPTNTPGWEVEVGNIGQHYFRWRYSDSVPVPASVGQPSRIVTRAVHSVTSGGPLV